MLIPSQSILSVYAVGSDVWIAEDTVFLTDTTRYTALQGFYCTNVTVTGDSVTFGFDYGTYTTLNGLWDAEALALYGYLSSEPLIDEGLGDLFPSTVYIYSNGLYGTLNETGWMSYIGNNYLEIHDANICNHTSHLYPQWLGQFISGGIYGIYRNLFYFDTSFLPKGVEIIEATLYFTPFAPDAGITNPFEVVAQKSSSQSMPFTYADWNKDLYSGNYGQVSTDIMNMSEYNILRLDGELLNLGGITKFALRSSLDINSEAPVGTAYDYIYLYTFDYGIGQPYLKITYSANAELVVSVSGISEGEYAPVYVDGLTIGYASSLNNYTIIYPTVPNNVTTHPFYTVSFGAVTGYHTPKNVKVTLGYGEIDTFTVNYFLVPPPYFPDGRIMFFGVDMIVLAQLLLIGGVLGFTGFTILDRFEQGMIGGVVGFMAGFYICATSGIVPALWFIVGCILVSGIMYFMWRRSE